MATNRQEGFFQRNLPKMGFALNTVTSVASGVVDLVAARIVSKSAGAGLAAGAQLRPRPPPLRPATTSTAPADCRAPVPVAVALPQRQPAADPAS